MKIARKNSRAGLTLIEVMIVLLIISIAVIGAMGFRTYCVVDAKKADVQINAARVGSMLLETWKGLGGNTAPESIGLFEDAVVASCPQYTITKGSLVAGPIQPAGFTCLPNKYQIRDNANNVYYYVTLSYKNPVSSPSEPEALNATISWNQNYGTSGSAGHEPINITTYQD